MHASFLELKPSIRIVDVGCGTGDFSRYLASIVPGKSTVIGVDMRAVNLQAAQKETEMEDIAGLSYRKGDAYGIPVQEGWADLTCCRTLLIHLTDPLKAVKEMVRVTRKGGMVAAFEPGFINSIFGKREID